MMAQGILPARKWKNGRKAVSRAADQVKAHQEAMERVEMATVLAQPHRMGSRSQLRENALGRFVEDNRLRRELYDAGRAYGALKSKWRAAKGAPMPDRLGGSGADIDPEVVHAWGKAIARCEAAVMACRSIDPRAYGVAALGYAEWLCVDGKELPVNGDWRDATCALLAIAVELGSLDQKEIDRRGINAAYAD
jgi:hypothetical protein